MAAAPEAGFGDVDAAHLKAPTAEPKPFFCNKRVYKIGHQPRLTVNLILILLASRYATGKEKAWLSSNARLMQD